VIAADNYDDARRAVNARYTADIAYAQALAEASGSGSADALAKEIIDLAGKHETSGLEAKLKAYDRLTEHFENPAPRQTVRPASAMDGAEKVANIVSNIIELANQSLTSETPEARHRAKTEIAELKEALAYLERLMRGN